MSKKATETDLTRLANWASLLLPAILYCYAISGAILSATLIEASNGTLLLICTVFVLAFAAMSYNLRVALISLGVLVLIAGAWVLGHLGPGGWNRTAEWFTGVAGSVFGTGVYQSRYDLFLMALLCGGIAFFTVVFSMHIFNVPSLFTLGMIIFIFEWIMDFFYRPFTFYLFLGVMTVFLLRRLNLSATRPFGSSNRIRNGVYTLAVMPLCVVAVLASSLAAPVSEARRDVFDSLTTGQITSLYDLANMVRTPDWFSVRTAGFGSGARLGGDVKDDDSPVMDVETEEGLVYLSGAHNDRYTGGAWQKATENYSDMEPDELIAEREERQYLLSPPLAYPLRQATVRIYPKSNTRILFVPTGLTALSDAAVQFSELGDIKSKTYYTSGEDYRATYAMPSQSSLSDVNLGRFSISTVKIDGQSTGIMTERGRTQGFYTSAIDYLRGLQIDGYRDRFGHNPLPPGDPVFAEAIKQYEQLSKQAQTVANRYLQLPDDLPGRVRELAEEKTASAPEGQDFTKAMLLRDYLHTFKYTLTPGNVPQNRDFVDFFLFDGKQGYCTYFATAMAVLCRAVGIPARYVEGYVTPPERGADNRFQVTNTNAHAWCEAYFEGAGWVLMEATPPYYRRTVPGGTTAAAQTGSTGAAAAETSLASSQPSASSSGSSSKTSSAASSSNASSGASSGAPAPPTATRMTELLLTLLIGLPVILVLAAIALLVSARHRRLTRLQEAPLKQSAAGWFDLVCRLAAADGHPRACHETALSFGRRLTPRYAFDGVDFSQAARHFTAVLYSKDEPTATEEVAIRTSLWHFYDHMLTHVRKSAKRTAMLQFFLKG